MTHEKEIVNIDSSDSSEPKNRCTLCGVDMGPQNPRQLCAKTYCMEKGYWFLQNQSDDDDSDDEKTGYPTLCKGRFTVGDDTYYALEEPTSLNTIELLPEMLKMGISAVKVEGRQRSPAYVAQVTRAWRTAIDDALSSPTAFSVRPESMRALESLSEGQQNTLGAYYRSWK